MNAFLGHLIAMLTRIAVTHKVHTPVHANLLTPETERIVLVRWVFFLSSCCCFLLTRMWSNFFKCRLHPFISLPFILFTSFPFLFSLLPSPFINLILFFLSLFSPPLCFFFLLYAFFFSLLHSPFSSFVHVRKYLDNRCVPYGAQFQISDGISLLLIRASGWQGEVCRRFTWHIQGSLMSKIMCLPLNRCG